MPNKTVDVHEIMNVSFLQVVEQLAFMFGEHVAKEELELDGYQFVAAEMNFAGDVNGRLCIVVPRQATTEIAANILGLESEDHQSQAMTDDALAEMLNVVCGHVVRSIVGSSANFSLLPPHTKEMSAHDLDEAMLKEETLGFILDDYPGLFSMAWELK